MVFSARHSARDMSDDKSEGENDMQTLDMNTTLDSPELQPGLVQRCAVLFYGVAAYAVGVSGLLWLILAMGGLAPVGFSPLQAQSLAGALAVDIGLIVLFGVQHSVMARPACKRRLAAILPGAVERATFVLFSGVCLLLAIWLWQPLPGEVWTVEHPVGRIVLWCLYALGWAYLFAATFVTNHFELMGLRQVYLYFSNTPHTALPFVRKYMYRYSRHPMMLGVLVGMWAVPVMSASHFLMAILLTLYIAVGVTFEERDLLRTFGATYRSYKREIAMLIPGMY